MQAISGAGRSPGVKALDVLDNVIPFIHGEEDKVQRETLKILGIYNNGKIIPSDMVISCTCTRVNVMDGHTESVFVSLKNDFTLKGVKEAFKNYNSDLSKHNLPSAPKHLIVVNEDPFRPQPRLDRNNYGGMATTVGRIIKAPALPNGVKYILVSHNTKMGAAKGAVLVAEYLVKKNYI
jgi:aspartate-semialdehyde dehydrogenase